MAPSLLAPWVPTAADPFDRRKAAHLLRRVGFGASPAEVDKAVNDGLEACVDGLFDEALDEEQEFQRLFTAIAGRLVNYAGDDAVRAWWIYRMRETRVPIREKLTLFWHGHFATSQEKVGDLPLMYHQIETIRKHAWGNVRDLTLAIARDPSMLVWLDGESSTKEHPNENFARELMELFTCGIGHYTENDVREAAPAFTGWHRDGGSFSFRPDAHDGGRKQFLGKSGRFDGGDIIDILMQQPATTQFLARKLLRFFATPEPSDAIVDLAAGVLERTRLDIKWFLREVFLSRWFYSDDCHRRRISSPAELVVGTLRTLEMRWPADEAVNQLSAMGQRLFAPPNVKGWDGERKWINSGTWVARAGFAKSIAESVNGNELGPFLDLARVVPSNLKEPEAVVARLADVLFQGELDDDTRQSLVRLLTTPDAAPDPSTEPVPLGRVGQTEFVMMRPKAAAAEPLADTAFRDEEDVRKDRIRRALEVVLSLPEYQAC